MRTIGLAAILALTSTAAFAGSFQFSVGGHNARIDFDESCTDRLCASVSWQEYGSGKRTRFRLPEVSAKTISKYVNVPKPHWNTPIDDDEDVAEPSSFQSSAAEPSTKSTSRARPADDDTAVAPPADEDDSSPASLAGGEPQAPVAAPASAPRPSARLARPFGRLAPRVKAPAAAESDPASASAASAESGPANEPAAAPTPRRAAVSDSATSAPTPSAQPDAAPKSSKVANLAPKPAPQAVVKPARPTPVGEWLVEDGDGKIRIEPCGDNLCGYVSAAKNPDAKDRHNPNPALRNRRVMGVPILINMEPDGKRWSGRIYNVKDGRSYTAHIALRNANTLRVEGCAFGGLICGGQNWSRVN